MSTRPFGAATRVSEGVGFDGIDGFPVDRDVPSASAETGVSAAWALMPEVNGGLSGG
jgi:hypothetical protein